MDYNKFLTQNWVLKKYNKNNNPTPLITVFHKNKFDFIFITLFFISYSHLRNKTKQNYITYTCNYFI